MDHLIETVTNILASIQGDPSYQVLESLAHDRKMKPELLLNALDELQQMGCVLEYELGTSTFYKLC